MEDAHQQRLEVLRAGAARQRGQHGPPVGPLAGTQAVLPGVVPLVLAAQPDGRTPHRFQSLRNGPNRIVWTFIGLTIELGCHILPACVKPNINY